MDTASAVDVPQTAGEIPAHTQDDLLFVQDATYEVVRIVNASASNTLAFVQEVEQHGPICVAVSQKMFLSDDEDDRIPIRHIPVESILQLRDLAGRMFTVDGGQ